SRTGGRPHCAIRRRGREGERDRWRRLRLRHLRGTCPGRHQDRLDEARVARRGRTTGVAGAALTVVRRIVPSLRLRGYCRTRQRACGVFYRSNNWFGFSLFLRGTPARDSSLQTFDVLRGSFCFFTVNEIALDDLSGEQGTEILGIDLYSG